MFEINFDAADEAAKSLREASANLRAQRSNLQEQMDSLNAERDALYVQALNKADAKQFLFDYIHAWGEQWCAVGKFDQLFKIMATPKRDEHLAASYKITNPYLCLRDIDLVLPQDPGGVPKGGQIFNTDPLPVTGNGMFQMSDGYIGGACFFFGDLIKAKLDKYFDLNYPEPPDNAVGVPVAERRVLIGELDQQIHELAEAIKQIDAKLSQLERAR